MDIVHGSRVSLFLHQQAAGAADRPQRVVVDFATGNHGDFRVEQLDQRAQDAALRLAAQPEQDEVVTGQNGVCELRDDGIFIADNSRTDGFPGGELAE